MKDFIETCGILLLCLAMIPIGLVLCLMAFVAGIALLPWALLIRFGGSSHE